ncbi:hypothetical protein V6Z94_006988 [Aspergillus fumigatus]
MAPLISSSGTPTIKAASGTSSTMQQHSVTVQALVIPASGPLCVTHPLYSTSSSHGHGFSWGPPRILGYDWTAGVGYLHEQERRNYLFAAKSGGWAAVKRDYDMPPLETIPFLRPLQGTVDPRSRPRREAGVSGLQWKIGWLDPGLLMVSEVPPHICRVLGAQEGDLHGG